jgi:hypothetical protein
VSATDHLRRYLSTGEPDVALLAALADLVRQRLRKSGMWGHPPEYFGYPEYHTWEEAFSEEDPSPGPAGDFFLEEVVPESAFFDQTLQAGNDVDALLRQKVRWFLTDRQKRHDPIGYRAFMNLLAVVEAMVADGSAVATNRVGGKIRNPTLVRLTSTGSSPPADEGELSRVIDTDADWQPVLRRLAKLGKGAQRLLRERLELFPAAGVAAFSVGELGAVLKARAREANEAWNRATEAGNNPNESRTPPQSECYTPSEEDLSSLRSRVCAAVEKSEYTPKVKRGMAVVFEDWLKYLAAGADHPPLREWAPQLGLSRSTLGDYLQRLQSLMRAVLRPGQAD